jgi:hypothetical protein
MCTLPTSSAHQVEGIDTGAGGSGRFAVETHEGLKSFDPEHDLYLEMHGARFRQKFPLEDAIGSHAFAPLEALPCV